MRRLVVICLLALLVSATAAQAQQQPITQAEPDTVSTGSLPICLYTGKASDPYVLISIKPELRSEYPDPRNIIPAPAGGCPKAVVSQDEDEPSDDEDSGPTGPSGPDADYTYCADQVYGGGSDGSYAPRSRQVQPGTPDADYTYQPRCVPSATGGAGEEPVKRRAQGAAPVVLGREALPLTGGQPLEIALLGAGLLLVGVGLRLTWRPAPR